MAPIGTQRRDNAMLTKTCVECKQPFEVEETKAWATRCLPCWIAQQDRQGKKKVESLQQEVDYWRNRATGKCDVAELEDLRRQIDSLRKQNQRLQADLTLAQKTTAPWHRGSGIPPEMLRRLIQLAHPDRHGGSDAANTATQWLLSQRRA